MEKRWSSAVDRIVRKETRAVTGEGWLDRRLRRPPVDLEPLRALVRPTEPLLRHRKRWLVTAHVRELIARAIHGEETRTPTNAEMVVYLWDMRQQGATDVDRVLLAQTITAALALLPVRPPHGVLQFVERARHRLSGIRLMQRQLDLIRVLRRPERRNPYWRTVLVA